MRKEKMIFLIILQIFSLQLFSQSYFDEHPLVQFKITESGDPAKFFEKEYRAYWETLPEHQQFAIACTCVQFYCNNQFPLDYTNKIVYEDSQVTGKLELLSIGIRSREKLLEELTDPAHEWQNEDYVYLKNLLIKYPDLSVLEIARKEVLTVLQIARLYMVKEKMDIIGSHDIEAWSASKLLCLIRWGMSAGYLTEEEGTEFIIPIVYKLKNDYYNFRDFMSHVFAGYCYNEIYRSNTPQCDALLFSAVAYSRAYIPIDELPFTGKNAENNHEMKYQEGIYTPSEQAEKLIPAVKAFYNYKNKYSQEKTLEQFLEAEKVYPQIADFIFIPKLALMSKLSSSKECCDFIQANEEYLFSLPVDHSDFEYGVQEYMLVLIKTFEVDKAIEIYNNLPDSLKNRDDFYFLYGLAYFEKVKLCKIILERNVCISRAKRVFTDLKNKDYELNESLVAWLERIN